MGISLKWQLRDDCGWKWLISFTDEQKVVQMKPWTFCSTLSVFIRIYTVCMCCLSLWRLLPLSADGSYVSLAWVIWYIYHSSAACVMMNTFPPLDLYTKTFYSFISLSVKYICIYTHAQIEFMKLSCKQRQDFLFLYMEIANMRAAKTLPLQRHWLSQWLR